MGFYQFVYQIFANNIAVSTAEASTDKNSGELRSNFKMDLTLKMFLNIFPVSSTPMLH